MTNRTRWSSILLVALAALGSWPAAAQQPARVEVVSSVVQAAEALVATLDADQRKGLLLADQQRLRRRWSNLPTGMLWRNGLRLGDLSVEQRRAVRGLIAATLSEAGLRQLTENMNASKARQGVGADRFGGDAFYIAILGKPSATTPWMWQLGGHHLGINATIKGPNITLAPSLTGGQPMTYTLGGVKVRQMAGELDAARALIDSLTAEQRRVAVLADRFDNLAFGPGRDGAKPRREGIQASALSEAQQQLLLALIAERINMLNPTHAAPRLARIKADLARTWFSWQGPTAKGEAATFRIQGPTVLIELAPQHLGGQPNQHIHAVYRDPTNDYGAAWRGDK